MDDGAGGVDHRRDSTISGLQILLELFSLEVRCAVATGVSVVHGQ